MPGDETKIGNCEKILERIVFDSLPGARELPGVCTLLGVGMLLGEEAKIRNTRKFFGRSCLLIAWREYVARRVYVVWWWVVVRCKFLGEETKIQNYPTFLGYTKAVSSETQALFGFTMSIEAYNNIALAALSA